MKAKRPAVILAILTAAIMASQLNAYINLPSMPAIARALKTSDANIQLSVTITLIAFALSNLFYGPLSDYYGRRKIAIVGFSIFICGTIICVLAGSIWTLVVGRAIQGVGAGCTRVLARSVMRDLFVKEAKLIRASSYIGMSIAAMPMIAPTIGGYIGHYFGWHANFEFILGYVLLMFIILLLFFPETNKHVHHGVLSTKMILSKYKTAILDRRFIGFALTGSLVFAGDLCYNVMAPFLMQERLRLSQVAYGWLVLIVACGLIIGLVLTSLLSKRLSGYKLTLIGLSIAIPSGIIMVILALAGSFTVAAIVTPAFFYMMAVGFIYPACSSSVLLRYKNNAGVAAALYGATQLGFASLVLLFSSALPTTSQLPLAILLLALALLSATAFFTLVRSQKDVKSPQ